MVAHEGGKARMLQGALDRNFYGDRFVNRTSLARLLLSESALEHLGVLCIMAT